MFTDRADVGSDFLRTSPDERLKRLYAILPQFVVIHLAEVHHQGDYPLKVFPNAMARLTTTMT